jgi:hypothetical protein
MALDGIHAADAINALEIFLDNRRPPEHMRHDLDLSYRIDKQSVIIFELRPNWHKKDETLENSVAKATWVNTQKIWKIYWMRADLKWHSYEPCPTANTIQQFLKVVEEDSHSCFWG